MTAAVLSLVTFFSTALGGLFALRRRHQLYVVMGCSAGILIAAALLDLLSDAFELVHASRESSIAQVLFATVIGFVTYYSVDYFVHREAAGHVSKCGKATFGSFAALGLTAHSFLDGFAIGSAFHANSKLGILVAIAVIAHDFGDGVSTVAVVLASRSGLRASIGWLTADAVAPLIGCLVALFIVISQGWIANLLGFFAGSFLFIGAVHLLPEAEREAENGGWLYLAVLAGIGFIVLASRLLNV